MLAVVSISIIPYAFSEVSRLVATATALGFVAGDLLSQLGLRRVDRRAILRMR